MMNIKRQQKFLLMLKLQAIVLKNIQLKFQRLQWVGERLLTSPSSYIEKFDKEFISHYLVEFWLEICIKIYVQQLLNSTQLQVAIQMVTKQKVTLLFKPRHIFYLRNGILSISSNFLRNIIKFLQKHQTIIEVEQYCPQQQFRVHY